MSLGSVSFLLGRATRGWVLEALPACLLTSCLEYPLKCVVLCGDAALNPEKRLSYMFWNPLYLVALPSTVEGVCHLLSTESSLKYSAKSSLTVGMNSSGNLPLKVQHRCALRHMYATVLCWQQTEVECVHLLLYDVRLTNCLKVVELYLVWNDGMKFGHKFVV